MHGGVRSTVALRLLAVLLFASAAVARAGTFRVPGIVLPDDTEPVVRSTAPAIPPDEERRYAHGTQSYAFEYNLYDPRDADVLIHTFTGDFAAVPDTSFGRWFVVRRLAEFNERYEHPGVERSAFSPDARQQSEIRPCVVLANAQIACYGMSSAPYRLIGIAESSLPKDASVYDDPSRPVPASDRIRLASFAVSNSFGPGVPVIWYYGSNFKIAGTE